MKVNYEYCTFLTNCLFFLNNRVNKKKPYDVVEKVQSKTEMIFIKKNNALLSAEPLP